MYIIEIIENRFLHFLSNRINFPIVKKSAYLFCVTILFRYNMLAQERSPKTPITNQFVA